MKRHDQHHLCRLKTEDGCQRRRDYELTEGTVVFKPDPKAGTGSRRATVTILTTTTPGYSPSRATRVTSPVSQFGPARRGTTEQGALPSALLQFPSLPQPPASP
ncbi:hypothetical protein DPEC_G00366120 [Dallia pectoralis]|nr:hypothetical protein DPEC_G00366120 [Dallia pectoralis]